MRCAKQFISAKSFDYVPLIKNLEGVNSGVEHVFHLKIFLVFVSSRACMFACVFNFIYLFLKGDCL